MAARLLLPVPVGLANNGDAARLMCQLGADASGPPAGSAQWSYVRFFYPADPLAGCGQYRTSQLIQLRLTAWLHDLLGLPGVIDMREVVVQDCVLTGLALATLAWLLGGTRIWLRLLLLTATFVVLADATFADYAASPYSEPAAFIGLTGVALAAVAATSGVRRHLAFLIAVAAAALAVAAKANTATLALPLAVLLATRRLPLGRWRGRLGSAVLPVLGAGAVLLSSYWVVSDPLPWYEEINVSHVITKSIMPASSDPARVATDLGLPPSFARYSDTHWWSPEPIHSDPQYADYRDRLTRRNLIRYLTDHPATAVRLVTSAADDYYAFRPGYLGTYGPEAGAPPLAQECRMCLLPAAAHALSRTGFTGITVFWLASAAAAALLIWRSQRHTPRRAFASVGITLIACTIVQYVTVVFGDGVETTKHLVVGLFTAALAPVWLLAAAVAPGHTPRAARPMPDSTPHRYRPTLVGIRDAPDEPPGGAPRSVMTPSRHRNACRYQGSIVL